MQVGLKKFTEDAFKKLQKYCLKKHNIADVRVCQSFHKRAKKLFLKGKNVKPKFISFLKKGMPHNCVFCGDRFNKKKENEEHIEHVAYLR